MQFYVLLGQRTELRLKLDPDEPQAPRRCDNSGGTHAREGVENGIARFQRAHLGKLGKDANQ
jgi:hypothetical protein